jgi:hypothetical protein
MVIDKGNGQASVGEPCAARWKGLDVKRGQRFVTVPTRFDLPFIDIRQAAAIVHYSGMALLESFHDCAQYKKSIEGGQCWLLNRFSGIDPGIDTASNRRHLQVAHVVQGTGGK